MAFTDRIVQYPGRVKMTPVSGQTDVYDMTAQEGTVTTEGTLLNAANLNAQTQLDSAVLEQFRSAGMTGQYQNNMSDALGFLLSKPETGTNNGWTFVKLTGSLFIATRQVTPSIAIQTAAGALFTTPAEYDIAIPSFAQSVLFISGDVNGGRWITMTNVGTSPKWRAYSPVSSGTSTITIDFIMFGTY